MATTTERNFIANIPQRSLRLILLLCLLSLPAQAQVTVTDGDSLKVNGTTIRLYGIDAPELNQWCGNYPAGIVAAGTLEMLTRGKSVTCEPKTTDRYGRVVAVCKADGEDLSSAMVQVGMAWAFTRYSRDYVEQEALAKLENLGVHAHRCQPAWEYRRR